MIAKLAKRFMPRRTSGEPETERSISQTTPIQIGLVIGLCTLLLGGGWWAATVSTKLDVVLQKQTASEGIQAGFRTDVDSLKVWRGVVDTSGSPAVQRLRDEMVVLERKVDLHVESERKARP